VRFAPSLAAPARLLLFSCSIYVHKDLPVAQQVAEANDGWPSQFRFAGGVLVSVMAQLEC